MFGGELENIGMPPGYKLGILGSTEAMFGEGSDGKEVFTGKALSKALQTDKGRCPI